MPLVFIFITLLLSNSFCAQEIPKNRTLILTDISTDSDNPQSLICLLLYLNVIDIKGISVTASLWQKIPVHSDLIHRAIEGYGKVQSNLARHEVGFPSVKLLFPKVKREIAWYGMGGIGEGMIPKDQNGLFSVTERRRAAIMDFCVGGVNSSLHRHCIKFTKQKQR